MDYVIPVDSTDFVKASINEVTKTIFEAAVLVIAVVFLFLQSWRCDAHSAHRRRAGVC